MTISELIGKYPPDRAVRLEYCYLDRELKPCADDILSYEGSAGDLRNIIL